jgi:hypothetical protein
MSFRENGNHFHRSNEIRTLYNVNEKSFRNVVVFFFHDYSFLMHISAVNLYTMDVISYKNITV